MCGEQAVGMSKRDLCESFLWSGDGSEGQQLSGNVGCPKMLWLMLSLLRSELFLGQ